MNKKISLLLLMLLVCIPFAKAQSTYDNLLRLVYTLADDSFEGRQAGSPAGKRAAEYIANEFEEIGLKPFFGDSYYQPFELVRYNGNLKCQNVIGVIEGEDPILKNEYIIVGAHYDHIGMRMNTGRNLPGRSTNMSEVTMTDNKQAEKSQETGKPVIYNGADDNASGVATIIEVARMLQNRRMARTVVFVAFDAEEMGLCGSDYMVRSNIIPKEQVKLMFSVDMVGGLKYSNFVEYCGTAYVKESEEIFDVPNPDNLPVRFKPKKTNILGGTDSDTYIRAGIPGVYVNTGLKTPYHKPEDDPQIIDYEGMEKIAYHFKSVVEKAAGDAPEYETFTSPEIVSRVKRSKLQFGAAIGLGTSSIRHIDGPVTGKPGFAANAGLYANIPVFEPFGLQPEVKFERRSAPVEGGMLFTNSIQTPLNVTFTIGEPGLAVILQGGAYYNYILNGSVAGEKMIFGNEAGNYNQHQVGFTYGVGVNVGRITLKFVGNLGGTKLMPTNDGVRSTYRSSFLNIGYRF